MEVYFPERNVRVIAVDENIDSSKMDENNNDIVVPMKNMLNELYSRDLSRKVRSVVRNRKQNGEFLGNYAHYGYQKDPLNKNRLIIEESGAAVVRQIYELCASGHGSPYIAKVLNGEGIASPRNHRETVCPGYTEKRKYEWTPETIHGILRSPVYKGDMVQGIYECSRFKRKPSKRKPSDEWFITPNTHDPIISDELWHYVQNCLNTRKRVQRNGEPQLFNGFIKCAECGYALACAGKNTTSYYSCGLYRRKGAKYCSQHYINKNALIKVVLDDIRRNAQMAAVDTDRLASKLAAQNGDKEEQQIQALAAELKAAEARYAELDRIMEQLYEDKVAGGLTDARFRKLSDKYEAEQSAKEKAISESKSELERLSANKRDASTWLELIRNYADIQVLDRIVLGELVEKITVGEAQVIDGMKNMDITIYYRFVGAVNL